MSESNDHQPSSHPQKSNGVSSSSSNLGGGGTSGSDGESGSGSSGAAAAESSAPAGSEKKQQQKKQLQDFVPYVVRVAKLLLPKVCSWSKELTNRDGDT